MWTCAGELYKSEHTSKAPRSSSCEMHRLTSSGDDGRLNVTTGRCMDHAGLRGRDKAARSSIAALATTCGHCLAGSGSRAELGWAWRSLGARVGPGKMQANKTIFFLIFFRSFFPIRIFHPFGEVFFCKVVPTTWRSGL